MIRFQVPLQRPGPGSPLALLLAAMLLVAGATVSRAGDTQTEFVPELNAFLGLSEDASVPAW